jgi:NAD+ synthase
VKREGVVIGISGGVDSAVASALCIKALGPANVLGLILPEKESNPVSEQYALAHSKKIGLTTVTEDITKALEGIGTYERRDTAIRSVYPGYDSNCKSKIILPPDLLAKDALNYFTLKIMDNTGAVKNVRLNIHALRGIVAATNTKQVTRMMYLNYYADLKNYLVCGTTNRSEYMQGFFVKYGDGGVDLEPIAHLYKTQVYQLAEYLEVIPEIINREPSPDTFSFPVTDEEMYFRIPYTEDQVKRAFNDLTSKYEATRNQRLPAQSLMN